MLVPLLKTLGVRAILALLGVATLGGIYAHYKHVINDRAELRTELAAAVVERDSFKQAMVISQEATRRYAAQREADRQALDGLRSRLTEDDLREWSEQPLPPALVCRWKGEQCVE